MPDSAVLDVNELTRVRLENVPCVELSEAIVAHNLPIRSSRQHSAFDFRTRERTAQDWYNSASAVRNVTYLHGWSNLRMQFENKCQYRSIDVTHQLETNLMQSFIP